MLNDKTTRRVYSAEELHRLRSACSQPKLRESIEKNDDRDADLVKGGYPFQRQNLHEMDGFEDSPHFLSHRQWIEGIVADTPPPPPPSWTLPRRVMLTPPVSPTEHVLRGSKSFAARSFRSRASANSLRVPSSNKENCSTQDTESGRQPSSSHAPLNGFVLGEIAANSQVLRSAAHKFRPSPTPSLKKKKAEAIVKAHGSPQHVRVTAGGRIVPSEQSPLCHPRYGYSAIKVNGGLIKFAPNHPMGKAQWTQATQNGFVAQDVNGRLCQIVDGTILPLHEVDGALRLYVPAPNLNVSTRGSSFGQSAADRGLSLGEPQYNAPQTQAVGPPEPSPAAQTNALELEYHKLEHELKELDKTEVLHGRTMGKVAKDALFGKRRELVMTLDKVRKAIKSIKCSPPPNAPTSPRAMQAPQQMSPGRNRLPAFLQDRTRRNSVNPTAPSGSNNMMPGAYGPFYGVGPAVQTAHQFGFPPVAEVDSTFDMPPVYGMTPSALFVPPPPFDGSMASSYNAYPMSSGSEMQQPTAGVTTTMGPDETANTASHPPQTDGAGSMADLRKAGPSSQSHALEIKVPEPKNAATLNSTLNPMSPAYKPGAGVLQSSGNVEHASGKLIRDRVLAPLSPIHQLRPTAATSKSNNMSTDTISPTKKDAHLHSSSTSSFETADFFPRDTQEYSTRKYAYPELADNSEDKENVMPPQQPGKTTADSTSASKRDLSTPHWKSSSSSEHPRGASTVPGKDKYPIAPPGTPVADDTRDVSRLSTIAERRGALEQRLSQDADTITVPDREIHNFSPKNKRQDWAFVQEHPENAAHVTSTSPQKFESARQELCVTSSPHANLDFSAASTEWIEGYRAGLARRSVRSDRDGEFLDGYCAGLLKSKPTATNLGTSTGSPVKPISRRPSPAVMQSSNVSGKESAERPFEINLSSMDTLKQAVFAPQNETAVLSPTNEGPHANDPPFNLGAWAKNQMTAQPHSEDVGDMPAPTAMKRHSLASENSLALQHRAQITDAEKLPNRDSIVSVPTMPVTAEAPAKAAARSVSLMTAAPGNRVSSMTSIDANVHRQWPGHRVFSPHLDWKSATSIAQTSGLASALFTGTDSKEVREDGKSASKTSIEAKPQHSRFKEGSIDGITNPPNSPEPKSPPMPPSATDKSRVGKTQNKKDSPTKPGSPAKVKFEHIAEKVGIKVSATSGQNNGNNKADEGSSPSSLSGKRRWRDVWRVSASRKDVGQDEKE